MLVQQPGQQVGGSRTAGHVSASACMPACLRLLWVQGHHVLLGGVIREVPV